MSALRHWWAAVMQQFERAGVQRLLDELEDLEATEAYCKARRAEVLAALASRGVA